MKSLFSKKHTHLVLTIALFALLLVYPIVSTHLTWEVVVDVFVIAILVYGVMVSSRTKKHFVISASLASVFLLCGWMALIASNEFLELISSIFGAVYFSYVAVILLQDIFRQGERVSMNMIYSSICVYLLIGLVFAFFYLAISIVQPGSFSEPAFMADGEQAQLYGFIYFSFVTLSTLGYGDVSPNAIQVAAFVYMEAIIGQLYLTILIARLVGLQISQVEFKSDKPVVTQRGQDD